ncbi:hypothetical protein NQ315_016903 [Exocentrus adspersus]|uniref:ZAD domain-containing protein n=1 Tax=Exocentrus adspersus TaxID=1586481 RepID=A0AAV8VXJ6_9CUCU|nr:hypothetical protein NQ315_016903 [Exocentrus adspersus]
MADANTDVKVIYKDFPIICRICLLYGNLYPFEQNLLNLFKAIINIELTLIWPFQDEIEEKLPQHICTICSMQLKDLESFITRCKNNQVLLRNVYFESKFKSNNEYVDSDANSDVEVKYESVDIKNCEEPDSSSAIKEETPNIPSPKRRKRLRKNRPNPITCTICNKTFYGKSALIK